MVFVNLLRGIVLITTVLILLSVHNKDIYQLLICVVSGLTQLWWHLLEQGRWGWGERQGPKRGERKGGGREPGCVQNSLHGLLYSSESQRRKSYALRLHPTSWCNFYCALSLSATSFFRLPKADTIIWLESPWCHTPVYKAQVSFIIDNLIFRWWTYSFSYMRVVLSPLPLSSLPSSPL